MREQRWQISGGATNTLSQYLYGYDDGGNPTWKRASGKGDVFRYDALEQITNVLYEATNPDATPSAWTNEGQYTYDAAGSFSTMNITNSGSWDFSGGGDNLNRYYNVLGTGVPGFGFTYTYDKNGNQATDPTGWGYNYDRENRLITATNATVSVTNTYDMFNRLVERQVGAEKTRYIYDHQWRVIAEYSENNTLKAKYVYGPGIDEPIRMTRNSTNYYFEADALGSIVAARDPAGNLVESYGYDAYGAATIYNSGGAALANSAISNRFMFQGRDRDPDTGLYNYRYRYYHPTLGRFVQPDPIRQSGGLNLYTFVDNQPILSRDPFGLLAMGQMFFPPDPPTPQPPVPPTPPQDPPTDPTSPENPGCSAGHEKPPKDPTAKPKDVSDPESPNHDPNSPDYDPRLDPSHPAYDPNFNGDDSPKRKFLSPNSTKGAELLMTMNNGYGGLNFIPGLIWGSPLSALGLILGGTGMLFSGPKATLPNIGNNAIQFQNNPLMFKGNINLGNTQNYNKDMGPKREDEDNRPHTYGEHEEKHIPQQQLLGPLYIPAYIIGGVIGLLRGGDFVGPGNPFETGPYSSPPRSWP